MDIVFKTKKLCKLCNSLEKAQKKWGTENGLRVIQRLNEIHDADNLRILRLIHSRCHPLTGDKKGQWSVDLKHPYRLLFESANEPVPTLPDGGLDIDKVTAVRILNVEDTHG